MPTIKATTSPDPKIRPVPVFVVQNATSLAASSSRVKTCVSSGRTLRSALRHLVGVGAGLQRDQPEIDRIARSRARAGAENPEKRLLARQHDSKPEKPGAERVAPADRDLVPTEIDDAAGIEGAKIARVWRSTRTVSGRSRTWLWARMSGTVKMP